jgi:hypothetical protein
MKSRTVVSILVLTLLLVVVVYSYAARKKTTVDVDMIYEILTGTWINHDYDDESRTAKYVIHRDGSYDRYLQVDSELITGRSEYKVLEAWTDSEGIYWYRAITKSTSYVGPAHNELGHIDTTKSVWESVWSTIEIPEDWEWNPDDFNVHYSILYRQE